MNFLPLVGAILALTGALSVAAWNQLQSRRDRRRDLYSAAYKAVLRWAEFYYRVRRRDPEDLYSLVVLFHEAQEEIDYHDGWISIESPELARAYRHFVRTVKATTAPLIQAAWDADPCDPRKGFTPPNGEQQPDIKIDKERFLTDVNDHLAPWFRFRGRALRQRYPET